MPIHMPIHVPIHMSTHTPYTHLHTLGTANRQIRAVTIERHAQRWTMVGAELCAVGDGIV